MTSPPADVLRERLADAPAEITGLREALRDANVHGLDEEMRRDALDFAKDVIEELRRFSSRRAEILEAAGEGASARPMQIATLATRKAKDRADRAWEDVGIPGRLRLHQARHTYASFMIAAGVNARALSVFMGHSSIKVTFDLYRHLMPGTESEAAERLDRFLAASTAVGTEVTRTSALH
jgi:integrase